MAKRRPSSQVRPAEVVMTPEKADVTTASSAPVAAASSDAAEAKTGRKRETRAKGPANSGLARTGKLLARAWARYRASGWLLAGTAAVVAVPLSALSLSESLINDAGFNAYAGIATLVAGLALMTTIVSPPEGRGRIRAAYYQGTGALVRLVVALVVLGAWALAGFTVYATIGLWRAVGWLRSRLLQKTPAARVIRYAILALAWVVAIALVLAAATINAFAWVIVVYAEAFVVQFGVLAIILATTITLVPVLVVLVQHCYLLPLLVNTQLTPLTVLARSRTLVRRRFWATAGRLVALVGVSLVVLLAVLALALLIGLAVTVQNIPQAFFQLVLGVAVMPFALIYLYELFTGARDHAPRS